MVSTPRGRPKIIVKFFLTSRVDLSLLSRRPNSRTKKRRVDFQRPRALKRYTGFKARQAFRDKADVIFQVFHGASIEG